MQYVCTYFIWRGTHSVMETVCLPLLLLQLPHKAAAYLECLELLYGTRGHVEQYV